jgi:hypothetical protein
LVLVLVVWISDAQNETCKTDDKICSAGNDEELLRKELDEIEAKKKRLEEKLAKKRALEAKRKEKKEKKKENEKVEAKKEDDEEAKKKEKEAEEEKKAKSTWISPTKRDIGSGKCSLADLDACSESERRLLKARPIGYIGSGQAGSLVKTKTKSGALMVKAMEKEEDCLVKFILTQSELKDIESGVFVEVGAGDGISDSKTHKLETLRKWSGLCIEPRDEAHDSLKKERKCTALKLAVGQKEGQKKFSAKSHKLSETGNTAVDVKRLGTILTNENYFKKHIDFLRVHTNGTEMDVLKSIDLAKVQIDTISLPANSHMRLPMMLSGLGWTPVTTDEKLIEACPDLKTLFRKHFWPTPPEWKDLRLNWLSPEPKSWQSQNGLDIQLRLENFPQDQAIRKEMELLITTARMKVHMFWNGNSIGVYPFKKEKKIIPKAKTKPKGKPKKEDRNKTKVEEPEMFYYDYEIDLPLRGLKINKGRHTLWARLVNRDGGTPTGLENTTNFLVCETPSAYMILEARIQGENCLIDDWLDEGEQQEFYSEHGSLAVKVAQDARIKKEQEEWAKIIKEEREAQKKKEEEEKRRCEAGEEEFCPKKVKLDDVAADQEPKKDEDKKEEEEKQGKEAEEKQEKKQEDEQQCKDGQCKADEKPLSDEGSKEETKEETKEVSKKGKKGKKSEAPPAEEVKEKTTKKEKKDESKEQPRKAETKQANAEDKADPKEAIKKAKEAAEKRAKEEKKGSKEEEKKEPKGKEPKDSKKDTRTEKAKSKDATNKDGKPKAITSGKIEVGSKSVSSKVSKGDITVSKDGALQLKEEKNCTDDYGLKPEVPGRSCKDILEKSCEEPVNGFYWLNVTDSKEHGKLLNRWRLVQAKCDMEFNHGGWTRILVCSGSENSPWNSFGEDDFLVNQHAVQYLAGLSTQVHIRTYNRPDIFVVSVPGAAPIQLLRQGAPLNVPIHNDTDPLHGVKNNWYGSMTHFLNWKTGKELAPLKLEYPQVVYWAANNANGLHIVNQPPPAASKLVKAGFGKFEGTGSRDKHCAWTLKEWHPIASVQRGSLPTTYRNRTKPHVVEDGRGMDALEVFLK